jgi:predicted Zn-dependent protease
MYSSVVSSPFFRLWVLCAAGACATSPAPKAPQPAPVSEADEIQMGREVDRALSAAHRFYGDTLLERYVHQVGLRLVAKCER